MRPHFLTCILICTALLGDSKSTWSQESLPAGKKITSLQFYWEDVFHRALDHVSAGYAYAIYRGGEAIAVGGHGAARVSQTPDETDLPMTADTRIQIASCSKPITATALLQVLKRKGIAPEATMWPLLKNVFKTAGEGVEDITIKHLLTHKSGYEFGYIESPRMKNAKELLAKPLPNRPGEKYHYSNINTSLARIILEIVSGKNYETFVRQEILLPASAGGMKLNVKEDEVSFSYHYGDLKNGKPITIDFRDEAAAYGWYATANELARFLRNVRTFTYLPEEATEQMFNEKMGWGKEKIHSGPVYRHDGQWVIEGNVGVRSGMGIFPDDVEAVLLINTNGPFFPHAILMDGFRNCYPPMSRGINRKEGLAEIYIGIPPFAEEVRWTRDGSEPTVESNLLLGAIILELPVTVKSRGFVEGQPVTFVNTLKLN